MANRDKQFGVGILLFLLIAVTSMIGCARSNEDSLSANSAVSNDHLRSALYHLDAGQEEEAISELQASLRHDNNNDRARVALASVYARQAGLNLNDWLEPIISAAQSLRGRGVSLRIADDLGEILSQESHQYFEDIRNARDRGDSTISFTLSDDVRDRLTPITRAVAKFLIGSSVLLDVFSSIPMIGAERMNRYDDAIQVLRERDVSERSEDVRVYLSILSIIRVVTFIKAVISDTNSVASIEFRRYVCSLEAPRLRGYVQEIRTSLNYLAEGVIVLPSDAESPSRRMRQEISGFIARNLESEFWTSIQDNFEPVTQNGEAATIFMYRYCRNFRNDSRDVMPSHSLRDRLQQQEQGQSERLGDRVSDLESGLREMRDRL